MEMDELSLQKVPYFFIIDFLGENVEIFREDDIKKSGLLIDFQNFSNAKSVCELNKKIEWKSFPETQESFEKALTKFRKIFVSEIHISPIIREKPKLKPI